MILKLLKDNHTTEETAIKSSEITYLTGYKGIEIRNRINRLRVSGEPICSSNKGYYYSNNLDDVNRTINNLNSRVSSINEAIEGLYIVMDKLEKERANNGE